LNAVNNSFPNKKLQSATKEKIENIIQFLTNGYDEIPNKLLNIRAIYVNSPLKHICNASLSLDMLA
jgi:hypothetical protein